MRTAFVILWSIGAMALAGTIMHSYVVPVVQTGRAGLVVQPFPRPQ